MGKIAAFGTVFNMGTRQVETGTVLGTITGSGNARLITTCTGMTGSPITTDFAVVNGDSADTVATKARAALQAVGNITALFEIGGSGPQIVLRKLLSVANISDLNISINNSTCTGLTYAPTSADTTAGVAFTPMAYVKALGGPGLSVNTTDVTTHDSSGAFEEVVACVIASGEVSVDLEFDPGAATHSAATNGLADRFQNKKPTQFKMTFPGPFDWIFDGFVTGHEPSSAHDAELKSSVKIKITGAPTLV